MGLKRWGRAFIVVCAAVGWAPSPASSAPAPSAAAPTGGCHETVSGVNLTTASITDLGQAMASGRLTSAALVDGYLARIHRV